eukprot:m.127146 g.127146  ORF g.127146 m.127146 type:complete len:533 (-) comp16355_c0_seq2:251-1849(-)
MATAKRARSNSDSDSQKSANDEDEQLLRSLCEEKDVFEGKVFNDPIHGHIELDALCVAIIDTPQFQRLRHLKQLGPAYHVFPGASHNRFEHCLGVSHLAAQLARRLRERQPTLNITDKDILCVEIAGLCHDLGHGPFSHLFDGQFIPAIRPTSTWTHEEASISMFDYMIETNNLRPLFEKRGLDDKDIIFIKEQIKGPLRRSSSSSSSGHDGGWPYLGRDRTKSFLYEIVANKRNGIDVDKWDYFARDCHHLGIAISFDYRRLLSFVKVLYCDGQLQICAPDKEVSSIYDMFNTRNSLHRRAYQHKTANIVGQMLSEILIKSNDYIMLPGKNGPTRMSEAIDDMQAHTLLTDEILTVIELSPDPRLAEAQRILRAINCRQLYKCVAQSTPDLSQRAIFDWSQGGEGGVLAKDILAIYREEQGSKACLSADDIVVHLVKLDYGMKDLNPVDGVRFYSKSDPNTAIRIRKDQISQLLPETFLEQHIRVYCKNRDADVCAALRRAAQHWCAREGCVAPKDSASRTELTPIKFARK